MEPKLVPVIVTEAPTGPEVGERPVITGGEPYVYPPLAVAEPPAVVTTTLTAPAAWAGVVTVTVVEVLPVIVPAVPPKVTDVVLLKLVPVIVTL